MPQLPGDKAAQVAEAESNGGLIEDGLYEMYLKDVEEAQGGKGPYWKWTFAFPEDAPQYKNWHQWLNTSLTPESAWRLKEAFDAFGVPTDTDTDTLVGKRVLVSIGSQTAQAGARKGELVNFIRNLHPLDTATVTADSGKVTTEASPLY